jgi:hypothetical protein
MHLETSMKINFFKYHDVTAKTESNALDRYMHIKLEKGR